MSDEFVIEKDVPIPHGRFHGRHPAALRQVLLRMNVGDSIFVPLRDIMPSMHAQPTMYLAEVLRDRVRNGLADRQFVGRTVWMDGDGNGNPNERVRLGLRIWRVEPDQDAK